MSKRGWPPIDNPKEVGSRLKAARLTAGISQRELAFAGCTAVYICRIEKGDRAPSLQVLRELARRLDVDDGYLAIGDEFYAFSEGRIESTVRQIVTTLPRPEADLALMPVEELLEIQSAKVRSYPAIRRGLDDAVERRHLSAAEADEIMRRFLVGRVAMAG
ncbi:helix-turn-helix transcriptional regulator [Candidatus Saccharibacteria bacterium]|nr:helix-turn-helix transcriptional regulator [Candidatus Saccharibacteria bacterium]